MDTILRIKQTAYPDGTVVNYLYGMMQPKVKNLGDIMKEAVLNYINAASQVKASHLTLEKPLSKAG